MVQVPSPMAVTVPPLTIATLPSLEDQVTVRLPRSWTSNSSVEPTSMDSSVLESSAGSVTVTAHSSAFPLLSVAVMVQVPSPTAVTVPSLTVATLPSLEDQVTVYPSGAQTVNEYVSPYSISREVSESAPSEISTTSYLRFLAHLYTSES